MSGETRVAVVTGGGSGLGAAISMRLARDGYRVVVADIDEVSSQQTVQMIGAEDGTRLSADPMTVDVRSEGEVAAMVDAVVERQVGPITVTGDGPLVVREKSHAATPMTLDQALYEMELVGHDFYLFVDKESERPSVVYRRRGYDYGVIALDLDK